jgi:hypothetical protein
MELSREQAGRWRTDYGTVLSSMGMLEQALSIHISHLQSVGNRLLEYYRGENISSRSTPPPAHFAQDFALDRPRPTGATAPKVLTEEEVTRLVQEATLVLQNAVTTLNTEFQTHMGRFATITEVLATGT